MRNLLAGALAMTLLAPATWAWGPTGHQAIARLAALHLNPRAQQEIAKLLEENETLITVSTWADQVRPQRKETGPWHFIDIPIDAERGDWETYCPAQGCVIRKINELIAFLKSGQGDRTQRAEALKFLVHFVGDLHQPLHAGEKGDRGGNDVPVVFFDKAANLHWIWDSSIIDRLFEREPEWREKFTRQVDPEQRSAWVAGGVADWAWDSVRVSKDVVYGNLPAERPAVIRGDYQAKAEGPALLQLRKAGVRLAKVLNDIWPE
jgi:hypothetical protein